MTIPYTYVIGCPNGQRYYGVRYASGCHPNDLWLSYFTSSKHVKRMLAELGPNAFTYEVRRTFNSRNEALEWEERVLRRLRIGTNAHWINGNNCRFPILLGDANPSKRPEVRRKISESKKGKPRPDLSKRWLNDHPMSNPASLQKMIDTRKERIASGEIVIWNKGKVRPEISGELHPRFGKKYAALGVANSVQYTCPNCGKVGKGPGMKRYHFDNCKQALS